jgi:hypothetical protein
MINFFSNYIWICLPLITLIFILYCIITNGILLNIFDPIVMLNFTNSIISAVILVLYIENYINFDIFIFYVIFIFSFYLFIYLSSINYKKDKKPVIFTNINYLQWKHVFVAASFLVFISILCNLWFSYLMVSESKTGIERLLLRKNYIVLDLLKRDTAFIGFILLGLSLNYLKDFSRKNTIRISTLTFVFLILFAISGFISGNKALFTGAILHLGVGYFFLSNTNPSKKIILLCYLSVLIICVYYSIKYYIQSPIYKNIPYAFVRIIAQADIFILAFTEMDFNKFTGMYKVPMDYLFHTFYRIFGWRGYNLPLGANVQQVLNPGIVGGPNSPFMAVLGVLYYYHLATAMLFGAILGFLIGISRYLMNHFNNSYIWVINVPIIFYLIILLPRLFQDYGSFTQQCIGFAVCYVIFLFILYCLEICFLNSKKRI